MSTPFPRDLVGYGGHPPHPRWPGEARIAVNFVMNFTFVKDGFDVLYREGKTQPKMMSLGLHMRLTGHPSRAAGLERALDYMTGHHGVWFTRGIDIARHWVTNTRRRRGRFEERPGFPGALRASGGMGGPG